MDSPYCEEVRNHFTFCPIYLLMDLWKMGERDPDLLLRLLLLFCGTEKVAS